MSDPARRGRNALAVRDAWGAQAPDWIAALAEACDASNQTQVGKRLGLSGAAVNQALRRTYRGKLDRMEQRVRGELMRETVDCPVLGDISKRECLDHQGLAFAPINPLRVRLYTACRSCSHRRTS